jgi:hypothetical protein
MTKQERHAEYDPFAWFYDRYWSPEIPPQIMTGIDRLLVPFESSHFPLSAFILALPTTPCRFPALVIS